jgi:hypothetical protein
MLDFLKPFLQTIKSYKRTILIVFVFSIIAASINEILYKPKYIAQFEVAPHFEFAYDLGRQLEKFVHDLNTMSVKELTINRGLNIKKENVFNLSFSKFNSKYSHNWKHVKLRITVESENKYCKDFEKIDKYLIKFCDDFITDTTRRYKGIEVLKTKQKLFKIRDTSMIRDYHITKNFFKHKSLKEKIEISDELVSKIIRAEIEGELENAKKNNFNNLLHTNIRTKTRLFKAWQFFLLISLIPCFALISILRSKM